MATVVQTAGVPGYFGQTSVCNKWVVVYQCYLPSVVPSPAIGILAVVPLDLAVFLSINSNSVAEFHLGSNK